MAEDSSKQQQSIPVVGNEVLSNNSNLESKSNDVTPLILVSNLLMSLSQILKHQKLPKQLQKEELSNVYIDIVNVKCFKFEG